jgi:hypothetical protein
VSAVGSFNGGAFARRNANMRRPLLLVLDLRSGTAARCPRDAG